MIHVILSDDTNNQLDVANALYVGEVTEVGNEYIAVKDEYGDEINLRDRRTVDIENFANKFMEVASKVNWNCNPKLFFQISDSSNKKLILEDLYQKLKSSTPQPMLQKLYQVNNTRLQLVPFLSSHGMYCSVNIVSIDPDTTLYEAIRTLLTQTWRCIYSLLAGLWDTYKKMAQMVSDITASAGNQFSKLILADIKLIETKMRVDSMSNDMASVAWAERAYKIKPIDLRNTSTNTIKDFTISTFNQIKTPVNKVYVVQDRAINSTYTDISVCYIDVFKDTVIDVSLTNSSTSGVSIAVNSTKDVHIQLRGGARYFFVYTPDIVNVSEVPSIGLDNALVMLKGRTLTFAESIRLQKLFLKTTNSDNYVELIMD